MPADDNDRRLTNEVGAPQRRTEGYAILQSAGSMIRAYLATASAIQNRHLIDGLWAAIAPHDPKNYRGIGCLLQGLRPPPRDWNEAEWLAIMHVDPADPLMKAILALGRYTEDAEDDLETGDLLFDVRQVREVLALAPPTGPQLSAVKLRRDVFVETASVVGFDVGYWGGDHYSAICDSIVTPTWHPPHPEDFEKVAAAVASLNENLLFRTVDDAAMFRARYMEFPWAETEGYPGEFAIIQIEAVGASFRDHAG